MDKYVSKWVLLYINKTIYRNRQGTEYGLWAVVCQLLTYIDWLHLGINLWKFINLYAYDLYTFLTVHYISVNKLKNNK